MTANDKELVEKEKLWTELGAELGRLEKKLKTDIHFCDTVLPIVEKIENNAVAEARSAERTRILGEIEERYPHLFVMMDFKSRLSATSKEGKE